MSEMHSAVEHPTVYAPMQYKGETSADNCKARFESYKILHKESVENPNEYWDAKAKELIDWFSPYHSVSGGDFINGDVNWFAGGKLNACYNCVDRHLATRANDTAIIWESDEPSAQDQVVRYTYAELCREVCRVANVLKERGVRKGDCVTIYMPMIPELAMCMLACARIGAVHSVVFAGFSADSLRDRIVDCNSKVIITANEGRRGGKTIALKNIVDAVGSLVLLLSSCVFPFPYLNGLCNAMLF
jgi:acetyl-CoA synthetase